MDNTKTFPFRLQYAREIMRKMSQEELSKKSGIPNTLICKFENGEREPSFQNLKKMAIALEISADYLFGFTTNEGFAAYIPLGTFDHLVSQLTSEDITLVKQIINLLIKRRENERY
jgi:transcriptional regulator with XRE-family HTH domain